jgi:hypothetical protein
MFFFLRVACCASGARRPCILPAFFCPSLGWNISLGKAGGWPLSFRMPNLPNQQSHSPNHLSREQTDNFAGNCWPMPEMLLDVPWERVTETIQGWVKRL